MKTFLLLFLLSLVPFSSSTNCSPTGGKGVILLDFNGNESDVEEYGIKSFVPADMTPEQIDSTVIYVKKYFEDFDVEVTTNDSLFNKTDKYLRIRVVITETVYTIDEGNGKIRYPGGISTFGSVITGSNLSAFVFPNALLCEPRYIAQAVAHEVGHSVGLLHQSEYEVFGPIYVKLYEYDEGNAEIAPIMGKSYNAKKAVWRVGRNSFGNIVNEKQVIAQTWRFKPNLVDSK